MGTGVATERLLRDVHPAEVLVGERLIRDARVFLTSRRLLVFTAGSAGIERALEIEVRQPCGVDANRGTLQGRLEIPLPDDTTVLVNPGRGCGCGSPLKALGPPVGWR